MITAILVDVPKGVSIRRLDNTRRAQNQKKAYAFSAWRDGKPPVVYGNSVRDAVKKLPKQQ